MSAAARPGTPALYGHMRSSSDKRYVTVPEPNDDDPGRGGQDIMGALHLIADDTGKEAPETPGEILPARLVVSVCRAAPEVIETILK